MVMSGVGRQQHDTETGDSSTHDSGQEAGMVTLTLEWESQTS